MVNTVPIQRHEIDHRTPIFDQLMADWGHTPGTLTDAQEEEMREYAAKLAADPNPIVKGFEPAELTVTVGEVREQPVKLDIPAPVAPVIRVTTLADKGAQEAADAIVEAAEAPHDPDAPELLPEAATQLLERIVPGTEETAVMPPVAEAETAVLPVVEPEEDET